MKIKKENPKVLKWIEVLESSAKKSEKKAFCKRILGIVSKPSRKAVAVNLYKINKYSKNNDNIIVPGKILSTGSIDHPVSISAIDYSAGAMKELKNANCNILNIEEIIGKKNLKIII
jgi:large subunit ribosomal protein L18e